MLRRLREIAVALVFGVGAWIAAPGINGDVLADFFRLGRGGPLLSLYNWVVGGALSRGALLAIGIMPYISARIFLRLGRAAVPEIAAMAREDAGRDRLRRWTRGLTFGLALVQSYGFARFVESLPGAVAQPGAGFIAQTMLLLTSGAMCVTWLSERIDAVSEGGAAVSPAEGGVEDKVHQPLLAAPAPEVALRVAAREPVGIHSLRS